METKIANEFIVIPGYSKYSTNGKVVKNVSTNKVQSVKTGTDKFQLFADGGQRNTLNLEKIKSLLPAEEKPKKEVKPKDDADKVVVLTEHKGRLHAVIAMKCADKPNKDGSFDGEMVIDKKPFGEVKSKAVKVKTITTPEGMKLIKEDLMRRDDVSRIINEAFFKGHEKIYRLHKLGLTNKEIQAVTEKRAEVVSRDLWLYSKGKLVFKG